MLEIRSIDDLFYTFKVEDKTFTLFNESIGNGFYQLDVDDDESGCLAFCLVYNKNSHYITWDYVVSTEESIKSFKYGTVVGVIGSYYNRQIASNAYQLEEGHFLNSSYGLDRIEARKEIEQIVDKHIDEILEACGYIAAEVLMS